MKTSFLTIAAAALLLAGCSKEEFTESISEGGSLVATPTNGLARLGRAGDQPSVKFKNSRIVIGLNNTKTDEDVPLDAILADGGGTVVLTNNETTPPTVIELPLTNNNGNENQRYRTPQFELSSEVEFDLFDIEIKGVDGTYLWGASIFIREDGKAVENNPSLVLRRAHIKDKINQEFDETVTAEFRVVIEDDPTQQVAQLKFVPDPIYPYADDPTYAVYPEPMYLEKTHENQNIGRSRWIGIKNYPKQDSYSGVLYSLDNNGGSVITLMSWGRVLD